MSESTGKSNCSSRAEIPRSNDLFNIVHLLNKRPYKLSIHIEKINKKTYLDVLIYCVVVNHVYVHIRFLSAVIRQVVLVTVVTMVITMDTYN